MNSNKKSKNFTLFYLENTDFTVIVTDPSLSDESLTVKEKMIKRYRNTYGCSKCYQNKATRFFEDTKMKINSFICEICGYAWKNRSYILKDSPKGYNVSKIITPISYPKY